MIILYFYCEKNHNDDDILLDVLNLDELKKWWGNYLKSDFWLDNDNSSMLLVYKNKKSNIYGLKSGFWYDIPDEIWNNFDIKPVNTNNNMTSLLIRAELHLKDDVNEDFSGYIVPRPLPPIDLSPFILPTANDVTINSNNTPVNFTNLKLHILQVGHGNWNEIKSRNFRLIYDVGADYSWSPQSVRNLVASRSLNTDTNLHVVISHWDADHYHGILSMSPADIACIRSFIAPSNFPGNNMANTALQHLINNGLSPQLVPHAARLAGNRITLTPIYTFGCLNIYRATAGSSRNQTGIALYVNANRHTFLTGDHHYHQVYDYMIQPNAVNDLVIVIPHHGGNAGTLDVPNWSSITSIEAFVSRHPTRSHVNHLVNTFFSGPPTITYNNTDTHSLTINI